MKAPPSSRHRGLRIALWAAFLLAALLLAGSVLYLSDYYHADDTALAAFQVSPRPQMTQDEDGDLIFGLGTEPLGLIFYPGGKVEHRAYAPLMELLASRGVFCVLCEMPFRLAVFAPDRAVQIRAAYPQIGRWYLGGHSLGGVMAASCLSEHPSDCEGLILLASYSTEDLSGSNCRVLSIRGSEDRVLDMETYESHRGLLPEDFTELVLPGGCHSGFGMYGPQDGDGVPTLSGEAQIRRSAEEILAWMHAAQKGGDPLAEAD